MLLQLMLRDYQFCSKSGIIYSGDITTWADDAIVRMEEPNQELIQLSLTDTSKIGEIISLLSQIQNSKVVSKWEGLKCAIPEICNYIQDSPDKGEIVAHFLYDMTRTSPLEEPPPHFSFPYSADDEYYLARDMIIGSLETVHHAFVENLQLAAVT